MAPLTDIAHWRAHIFSRLLTIVLVLGVGTAIPSIALAAKQGLWSLIVVDIIAIGWLCAVWRLRGWSYRVRVFNFITIMFLVSAGMLVNVGQVAQIYLIAPPVFAAVLLGPRPALGALAISGLLILGLSVGGHVKSAVGVPADHSFVPSLIIALNFMFIGALITVSCSTLLQKLATSLGDLHGVAQSLEEGKDALHSLNTTLRLSAAAVAQLNDMVLIAATTGTPDVRWPIIFANDAFVRGTGYAREAVLGRGMMMFSGAETDPAVVARLVDAMRRGEAASAEIVAYTSAGTRCWIDIEIVPFLDESGAHTHWVIVARDIGERKKAATAIHRLAYYDVLTDLPNRRFLTERLDVLLAEAQAGQDWGAVVFIDLDHFKYVNDARGHATGDALLRSVAGRLSNLMQGDDTVARIGGDEFVVLLPRIGHDIGSAMTAALARAEGLRHALLDAVEVDGNRYNASASLGVTLLPPSGQSAHDLLREADTAMYHAKARGRNGVVLFEATMRAEVEQRLTLERELAGAIERGELAMHLQLQCDAAGTPIGAETLMRWQRADGRFVPPDVFIPIAEASGLIVRLGQWALHQTCLAWLRLDAAGHPMPLSVNVSPLQFGQADFVEQVGTVLAQTGVPANGLILELTEGLLIKDRDATIARMHALAATGIRFSIDDFGTGYSNLGYLKRMPLYELKIDKSFIRDTPDGADGDAIVCSILAMAAHLRLRVVAEGVETRAQADFLAANGCPSMQGYLFARPQPLDQVLTRLGVAPVLAA
ncbi:putative bifunctional diguanylate cyclase/phosphodiesterase [Massilia sp. CMS3.1]|uniref:putative bifunctional diguanylate cyclase/phosphodiesterase n=1 Tax=Massilia sp. CMS3.1 TaxID=3373083 RepID=UPI003EE69BF2